MKMGRRTTAVLVVSLAMGCAGQNHAAQTGFRIAGVVVDRLSGQPLAGTNVLLAPIADRQKAMSVRSGSDGRFFFANLAPGKYSLGAKRRGYTIQGYEEHEVYATAIAVGEGIDSEHILFRLRPDATIRGTISDDRNDPASEVTVRLFSLGTVNGKTSVRHIMDTMADDRGQSSFAHLRAGTYYVAATGRPWYATAPFYGIQPRGQAIDPEVKARQVRDAAKLDLVFPLTFYSGALSSEDATPIRVNNGDNATADMVLQPVPSVHIHVPAPPESEPPETGEQESGRSSIGNGFIVRRPTMSVPPEVRLSREIFGERVDESGVSTSIFREPDGSWEFGGIAPGHYTLRIDQPGDDKVPARMQEVDLSGNLDLSRSDGATLAKVSGTMWLNNAPVERGIVELRALGEHRGYGAQVYKGRFEFKQPVPPGSYEIAIIAAASEDVYLGELRATGAKASGRTLQIASGAPVTLALFTLQGIGQIDGVAKLKDKPTGGVMILLLPEEFPKNDRLVRRDQSDSDGTFTLPHVVPGKYRLVAIKDGWDLAWADPKILAPYFEKAPQYVVQPNQKIKATVEVQEAK